MENMESEKTETNADDVNEPQLPDWLVGVIVVIVLLVIAVIVLIITTFIKNRSKSRSNMFSTTVCDDLESGKIGHNLNSTMMTSLTSVPNSINGNTLLSHSVTVSPEYDQQIASPTSADGIYGVLGCRNPLFIDEEAVSNDTINNESETETASNENECLGQASTAAVIQVPSTSGDCLQYDDHRRETQKIDSLHDQMCSLETEMGDTLHRTIACRNYEAISMADGGNVKDRNTTGNCAERVVGLGSVNYSLSLTTGSTYDPCGSVNDMVMSWSQPYSELKSGCDPSNEASVFLCQHVHFTKDEPAVSVNPRGCADGKGGSHLSRPTVRSEDDKCPAHLPNTENGLEVCEDRRYTEHSFTTQTDWLKYQDQVHGCVRDAADATNASPPATSPPATSTLALYTLPPSVAVATSTGDVPTPLVAGSTPVVAGSTPAVVVSTSTVVMSTPAVVVSTSAVVMSTPAVVVSTSTVAGSAPVVAEPTPAVVVSTPAVVMTTPAVVSTSAVAGSTPAVVVSTATVYVSTSASTTSISDPAVSTREIKTTVEQEADPHDRWVGSHNPSNSNEPDIVTHHRLSETSKVSGSPTTDVPGRSQDRNVDLSNNNNDLVRSDVNLQTPAVTRSVSDSLTSDVVNLQTPAVARSVSDSLTSDVVNLQTPAVTRSVSDSLTSDVVNLQTPAVTRSVSDSLTSDVVNLQTPAVTRPVSGVETAEVSQKVKGCADIFNVHL